MKGIMVGPKSIVYRPLLLYLIWMKIGTTTSRVQKILEKLQQLIHALRRPLLKFHTIWISTTIYTKMTSYMLYSHLNILSIVKNVKQQISYFSYIPYNTSILWKLIYVHRLSIFATINFTSTSILLNQNKKSYSKHANYRFHIFPSYNMSRHDQQN